MTADFAIVSRRRFLKYGLSAAGVLFMGGGGVLLTLRGRAPEVAGLRCLTAHEYRTFSRLAEAIFPRGGAFALGAVDLDLARLFDEFLADGPRWDQTDSKRALALLEFGPILFDHRPVTFSHLEEDERREHFERWTTSESDLRREVALGLRRFIATRFYDRPEAWAHIGYEGPLVNVKG